MLPDPIYSPPDDVSDPVKSFSEGSLGAGFVPLGLKEALLDLNKYEMFPLHVFVDSDLSSSRLEKLAEHVEEIAQKATTIFTLGDDEASWYPLVTQVLSFENTTTPMFPYRFRTPELLLEQALNGSKPYSLSPFNDATAESMIPCCFVEVKSPTGSYFEAQVQGTEVSLATLKNISQMRPASGKPESEHSIGAGSGQSIKPLPFITVVGHEWSLHWIYKRRDKNTVNAIGPISIGGMSTRFSIYKLVNSIGKLRHWLEGEYGAWAKEWYGEGFSDDSEL
ncbi:hypothetical protein TWF281_001662 [Arthrobotrys megalospora]